MDTKYEQMERTITNMEKTIFRWCVNSLTIVFFVCLVSVWILTQAGVEAYTILSGSMEPTLHTGDLVLVSTKETEIQRDDMIAFRMGGNVVVHRVVDVKEGERYVTKGDANQQADLDLVEKEQVVGEVLIVLRILKGIWLFFSSGARFWAIAILVVLNILAEDFGCMEGGVVVGNG